MYLSDLVESDVDLNISKDGKEVDLVSNIIHPATEADIMEFEKIQNYYADFKFCVLEPIYARDKLLTFPQDVNITLLAKYENLPYEWKNVRIVNVKFPDKGAVHLACSKLEGSKTNRRNGYRLPMLMPAEAIINDVNETINLTLKDLSMSGFSVTLMSEKGEVGDSIVVRYSDFNMKFALNGTIVRVQDLGNNNRLLGCKLEKDSDTIARYINHKQQLKVTTERRSLF